MFTGDKGGIAARWQPADHVQGAVLADRTVSPYGLSAKSCYQLRDSVLSCRHQRAAVRERSLTVGVSEPATNRRMKLGRLEVHDLLGIAVGRIPPEEGDLAILS